LTAFSPRERNIAAAVLLVARTVYAFNWYDIGAVPTPVQRQFGVGTVEFGIILAAFLVGAALFQVPAGLAALRWGNRSVSLGAMGLMGGFCLASAFAPNWIALAVLRFGAGVGAAFFFAPALGLITAYYEEGTRGPIIGLYNGGFAIGSAAGLIGAALVAESFGWAPALGLGGAMLLAVLPVAVLALPRLTEQPAELRPWRAVVRQARPVLASRALWALTLAGAGLWAGYYIAAQYFVEFAAAVHPSWSLALAAAVPTVMILAEIPSGPLGGWSAERSRDMRRPFLAWGVVAAVLVGVLPWLSFTVIWPAFLLLGFSAGVTWAVLYLVPTYVAEIAGERYALAVALLNSIQIFLGSALTLGFALLAAGYGYSVAWVFAGAVSIAFLPALFGVGVVRGRHSSATLGETGRDPEALPPRAT
jgi:ACDE family multidrug resistance protein